MQNELKVGQTFRVFDSNNHYGSYTPRWFSERNDEFYANKFGVNSCGHIPWHFNIDSSGIKQVGLLRITKLKCLF